MGIYVKSPLEVESDRDFNEQRSYFINTPSVPCSYETSPDLLSLSNIAPHDIFNPVMLHIPKVFERVVVDTYVYHKYCRSRVVNLENGTLRLVLEGKPLHKTTS